MPQLLNLPGPTRYPELFIYTKELQTKEEAENTVRGIWVNYEDNISVHRKWDLVTKRG